MENKKVQLWTEDAIAIRAAYEDFDGELSKWKDSFYQIWRWQLTWSYAYKIEIRERRANGVYLYMLIKPSFRKSVLGMLEEYGYKNVSEEATKVGVVESYEIWEDIEDVILE